MQFLCSTATFLCTSESNKHQTSWLIYFIWELCIYEISSVGIRPKSKSYVPNPSPNSKSQVSNPKSEERNWGRQFNPTELPAGYMILFFYLSKISLSYVKQMLTPCDDISSCFCYHKVLKMIDHSLVSVIYLHQRVIAWLEESISYTFILFESKYFNVYKYSCIDLHFSKYQ